MVYTFIVGFIVVATRIGQTTQVPSKHADVGMRSAASRVGVDTAASAIDRYDNVGLMMGESWHLIGSMPGERRHVNVGNW